MNVLKQFVVKILSLALISAGVCAIVLYIRENDYVFLLNVLAQTARESGVWLLVVPGLLLITLGIVTLLPQRFREGAVKTISYPGTHGNVIIQLDSVEANLNRMMSKLPEVKWISVEVDPDEDNGKAKVLAAVKLLKGPGESARETANRVSDRLADTAANLLGVDDITHVDLTVRGIALQGAPAKTREKTEPEPEHDKDKDKGKGKDTVDTETKPGQGDKPSRETEEAVKPVETGPQKEEKNEADKESPPDSPPMPVISAGGTPAPPEDRQEQDQGVAVAGRDAQGEGGIVGLGKPEQTTPAEQTGQPGTGGVEKSESESRPLGVPDDQPDAGSGVSAENNAGEQDPAGDQGGDSPDEKQDSDG